MLQGLTKIGLIEKYFDSSLLNIGETQGWKRVKSLLWTLCSPYFSDWLCQSRLSGGFL